MMKIIYFKYIIYLLLFFSIFFVKCNKKNEIYFFKDYNDTYNITNNYDDILFGSIKFHKNDDKDSIFRNFPKRGIYENKTTFEVYEEGFIPWIKDKFCSIVDFEFDEDNNIYLLDEDNHNNSATLYKYGLNKELKEKYILFEKNNYNYHLLNNFVIDKINDYAYIPYYNDSIVGILVKKLKDNNIISREYIINSSLLNYNNYNFTNEFFNQLKDIKYKLISLSLSCDGKYLLFCPLLSRMIYSIKTKKLRDNSIKFININDVNIAYKNDASSSLIYSNMGNLYLAGLEKEKVIYSANQIENDLTTFDFKIMEKRENSEMGWPIKLSINDGILNINCKKVINNTIITQIYRLLIDDDKSYIYKCAGLGYNWKTIAYIFWGIFIFIVILVLIFVIIGNEQDHITNKKNK